MNSNWKNKKVAVLGFGVEGISSAHYLLKKGAEVTVLDKKKEKEFDKEILKQVQNDKFKGVKFVLGANYLDHLNSFDLIVKSPGISIKFKELEEAKKKGIIITSQTKIFFDNFKGKIIGVTGTKGKGTTSSLIYEMLKKESSFAKASEDKGFEVYLGGNIGNPALNILDKAKEGSWAVLEMSSFQLTDLEKSPADAKALAGKPHIAVMLMTTSEHLDFHKDTKEYVEAKRNILRFQTPLDFAIINRDYPGSNESDIYTEGKVFLVSRERPCEIGCYVDNGKVILRLSKDVYSDPFLNYSRKDVEEGEENLDFHRPGRDYFVTRKTVVSYREIEDENGIIQEEIIQTKDILLPGKHNLENVCASVMAAKLAGVSNKNIASVLKTFKGLEHRLELVRELNGVKYYDDSFSTTPETAIAAIQAFNPPAGGEILILGGSSKNSDFKELGRVINGAKNIKTVIGIGLEWKRIKKELNLKNARYKIIENCSDMKEIVKAAFDAAKPGDVVLLSPACASFDMFKNYKDRGNQFKEEVGKLKKK